MTANVPTTDPHSVGRETDHEFWADAYADEIQERLESGEAEEPVVIKGGISPSGVPHLGNVNEIMRGNYVAETLRERGIEVRQVFTTDDRDPLRKVPRALADLDGNVVDLGDERVDAGALGRNLGKPYTAIDDPFGCCDSYGEHFSKLIESSADLLGVDVEVVSNTAAYDRGDFDDAVRTVLERADRARDVLADYQDKVDESYVPFNPVCGECGKITETVTAVDLAAETVEYRCTDLEAGDRTIEGCGHVGTATFRQGKLPWRFEWPAQWEALGVDFEPFGKDHAEGSWRSGEVIAREVFDTLPPVPMVYEWFTLNGEPFSSSEGNVVLVHDVLELVERDVLRYFFAMDPSRTRDFDVTRLDQLVNEFDAFEARRYDEVPARSDDSDRTGTQVRVPNRAYPYVVAPTTFATDDRRYRHCETEISVGNVIDYETWTKVGGRHVGREFSLDIDHADDASVVWGQFPAGATPDALVDGAFTGDQRVDPDGLYEARDYLLSVFGERARIPYTFAAVLGMFDGDRLRKRIAEKEGHLPPDAPAWVVEHALDRVALASEWAARTDNEYNYTVARTYLPDVGVDAETAAALDDLADFAADGPDGEALQGEIYETAKRHDIDIGDFFATGYRLFFDDEEGPQLGYFLAKLDREFVVGRLRRER